MKFLFDTNILIPLEPSSTNDLEAGTQAAIRLLALIGKHGHQVYRHPSVHVDLDRDTDKERRTLRKQLIEKYPELPSPPPVTKSMKRELGDPPVGSNNWVDHQLLAAVEGLAIDLLVTEDERIRKKAARLGFGDSAVTVAEAAIKVSELAAQHAPPPPAVESVKAHAIPVDDPILDSLRKDYDGFDGWFDKCRQEGRDAWIIGEPGKLSALTIVDKQKGPTSTSGKVLKICTFKVADHALGFRFGELLLKAVFTFAWDNDYDWLFIETAARQEQLIELLTEFGFKETEERSDHGDLVLTKPLHPEADGCPPLDNLAFHVRYGPKHFRKTAPWYMVPIRPGYAEMLFPETAGGGLFPGRFPFGNSIRKAYLCNAAIRKIQPGDNLLFYRSRENQGVIATGVVEETVVSKSSDTIAQRVGKRTVYSLDDIRGLCASGEREVLAILFRQALILDPPRTKSELVAAGVIKRPPQSIMTLQEEALVWVRSNIAA